MRRNIRQRAAACLLALLVQAGLIAVFLHSRPRVIVLNDDSQQLVFVLPLHPAEPPPPRRRGRRSNLPGAPGLPAVAEQESADIAAPEPPAPLPGQAGTAPRIDWQAEMERAVREAALRQEERELHGDPLDSKPDVLVIPERPHRAGDQQRYPDGAVLTWLSERCYEIMEPASPPPGVKRVCKEQTLAERRAEARRKELYDAMVPEYIRRPVPKPPPADLQQHSR